MNPLIILGVGVALLMMAGAGVALIAGSRGQVNERIEEFVGTSEAAVIEVDEVIEQERPDIADRVDRALSGREFFDAIRKRISMADVRLRVSEYIALQFIAAVGLSGIAFLFGVNILLVIIIFIVGLRLPRMYIGMAAGRRLRAFEGQLGDTLNLWVNALRSGYSVLQGMEAIATELPPPVSKEFERVVQEVRLGLSLEQALGNLLRRVPSEDLDLIITAVNIQREVGGNLAEILDIISHTIRERVRIKGEIRTLTAQGRLSGWIVSLLPVGLGVLMYTINPEYGGQLIIREEPFLFTGVPCGWLVIGVGVLMIGIGALAVRKIVDIEV